MSESKIRVVSAEGGPREKSFNNADGDGAVVVRFDEKGEAWVTPAEWAVIARHTGLAGVVKA